jgi:hypothetical protein
MIRPLGDLLRGVLPADSDWKIKLLQSWNQVMGTLCTKVRLEKIEDESLVLGVFDACWMQELYLLTPMLLANINQSLDRPRIKQLRFKRAGLYTRLHRPSTQKKQSTWLKQRPLTPREERALDVIVDVQLREALARFLHRCDREKL